MSRHTENYKNMVKSQQLNPNSNFKCCEKKVSIYNNNNTSNNVMNASPENNKILQDLTTNFSENSGNYGNYVYIQNTITSVSNAECATPSTTPTNVNYNEFYTSFNNLRNVLNDQNINQHPFIFKNRY